jgi:hypothetical protein
MKKRNEDDLGWEIAEKLFCSPTLLPFQQTIALLESNFMPSKIDDVTAFNEDKNERKEPLIKLIARWLERNSEMKRLALPWKLFDEKSIIFWIVFVRKIPKTGFS